MPIPASFRDRLSLPVIGSPMFIASTPELVIEQCKAGIIGSFPALNARPASQLDEWLMRIQRGTRRVRQGEPGREGRAVSRSTRSATRPTTACSTTWRPACATRCR